MKSFLAKFQYVPDYYYYRLSAKDHHIKYWNSVAKKGVNSLVIANEFPYGRGVLFIQSDSKQSVTDLIMKDPFYQSNLVQSFQIEEIETFED